MFTVYEPLYSGLSYQPYCTSGPPHPLIAACPYAAMYPATAAATANVSSSPSPASTAADTVAAISKAAATATDATPEFRARAQTWAGYQHNQHAATGTNLLSSEHSSICSSLNDDYTPCSAISLKCQASASAAGVPSSTAGAINLPVEVVTKKSSRRNPWGHETYAELIEIAINSYSNKMATLQQIYDHISANYKYFSDRNESASSAGWKNSIRHNLSLHDKFMKCPKKNENIKSSLWTISYKSNFKRNRSNSMDCKKVGLEVIAKRKYLKEYRKNSSSSAVSLAKSENKIESESSNRQMEKISRFSDNIMEASSMSSSHESNAMTTSSTTVSSSNDQKDPYLYQKKQQRRDGCSASDAGGTQFDYYCHAEEGVTDDEPQGVDQEPYRPPSLAHVEQQYRSPPTTLYPRQFQTAALEYSKFIADLFINDFD